MGEAWLDLLLVLGLVGVNGLLSGSEMAFVSLGERRLATLEATSRRGRRVAELARSPSRYLSALQLGITLAGFLASASAAVELSESVAPRMSFLGDSATAGAVVLVTILVSLVTLVLGELVPKRIAMLHAERWSLAAVTPLTWFMNAVRPILWVLEALTDTLVRVTGNDLTTEGPEISDDEFVRLVQGRASFDPFQRRIMTEAIAIRERTLRHILVPRPQVISIDIEDSAATALDRLREAGLSKAPLVAHDLDHPIGQVRVLDLVGVDGPAHGCARPILALPETLSAFRALRRLQASQTKLAVVIDEHGGTAGIVTFEDIIEELVGDLDAQQLTAAPGQAGAIVLPGSFPMHRMDELDISLPAGDYVTIAGLILSRMGRIPDVDDRIRVNDYEISITATDRTSIKTVTIRALPHAPSIQGSTEIAVPTTDHRGGS
jgi:putative hemolysin